MNKKFNSLIFIILFSIFYFMVFLKNDENEYVVLDNEVRVHFINVGQGDATFIELPDNKSLLIDAGEKSYGDTVVSYIANLGYNSVDYIIGTHPHTDHIGGLEKVLNNFDIGSVYMPKISSNSKTFENLLSTISDKGLKINSAYNGVSVIDSDELSISFVAPVSEKYSDLNNYSAVLLLRYGGVKFLFMGDAEVLSESEISSNIDVDIVKIGHHGSNTSSSIDFINRVSAKYGIISVGENSYGHPNEDVVSRWTSSGTIIYRTDINGNIVITTNGSDITVQNERS